MTRAVDGFAREARDLIERVFAAQPDHAAQHPLVFEAGHAGRALALRAEGAVRAACTILVRELVLPSARLVAGLIGSVATEPGWRGRGLGSRLVSDAERTLAREGAELSLLWADDPAFYRRLGYRELGFERDWLVGAELASRLPEPAGARALRQDDVPALHELYRRHPTRVERSLRETRALFGTPGVHVLVREREGALRAYACLGRGADLRDVIHEWAGDEDDVLALVRAHFAERAAHGRGETGAEAGGETGDALVVMSARDVDLPRLRALGADEAVGVLGMGKLLDARALARRLGRLVPGLAARGVRETGRGEVLELAGPRGSLVLDGAAALELVCPARGARTAVERAEQVLGLALAPLPLAPFVWGLDSI